MTTAKNGISETGSPPGEPVFVTLGRLGRPHGLRGEIRMSVWTDAPEERLRPGAVVYLGERRSRAVVRSTRWNRDVLLLAFENYPDRTAVEPLRNQRVYLPVEALPPPPEDEVYAYRLLGLKVLTDTGRTLGTLREILETGANDVYLVETAGGDEILLPDIAEVILKIDLEAGEMLVHLLEGLLP